MSVQRVDFDKLWQKMEKAVVAPAVVPTVLGGQFESVGPTDFLNRWLEDSPAMPWRIWEHVNLIEFGNKPDSRPQRPAYLQRADIFGEGGHLSLRRDGNRWYWRFVGPADTIVPEGVGGEVWQPANATPLRCYAEEAILWGKEIRRGQEGEKKGIGLWWEDRVGAATLKYPQHLSGISRVYLHLYRYTEAGRTMFVWYRGLGDETEVQPWP